MRRPEELIMNVKSKIKLTAVAALMGFSLNAWSGDLQDLNGNKSPSLTLISTEQYQIPDKIWEFAASILNEHDIIERKLIIKDGLKHIGDIENELIGFVVEDSRDLLKFSFDLAKESTQHEIAAQYCFAKLAVGSPDAASKAHLDFRKTLFKRCLPRLRSIGSPLDESKIFPSFPKGKQILSFDKTSLTLVVSDPKALVVEALNLKALQSVAPTDVTFYTESIGHKEWTELEFRWPTHRATVKWQYCTECASVELNFPDGKTEKLTHEQFLLEEVTEKGYEIL